jgi:hypothetical protein
MGKMMTTALAGAFLGLTAGGALAAGPFTNYNLNGTYVIQAHGFVNDAGPTDIPPPRRKPAKMPSWASSPSTASAA